MSPVNMMEADSKESQQQNGCVHVLGGAGQIGNCLEQLSKTHNDAASQTTEHNVAMQQLNALREAAMNDTAIR